MTTQSDSATLGASAMTEMPASVHAAAETTAKPVSRGFLRSLLTLDKLTVIAVLVVVVLVSIPRLRGFALRENELDAMRMLRALAAQPAPANGERLHAGQSKSSNGGRALAALVAQDTGLCRRLEDLEFLAGGHLRRHGYLFDLSSEKPGEPMLRAWPWDHGTTGRGAFVWTPQRGLLGYANTDGRFSGLDGAPSPSEVDGTWLSITYRR